METSSMVSGTVVLLRSEHLRVFQLGIEEVQLEGIFATSMNRQNLTLNNVDNKSVELSAQCQSWIPGEFTAYRSS